MYTFHITFEDQPAVQQLAAEARERLAGLDGLDLVPGQWLHLTTQGVGFSDEVSNADLAAITSAAHTRLTSMAPVAVTLTPPGVSSEGVACYAEPDGALNPARDALRAAISDIWGPGRVLEGPNWSPHVSIAYASADNSGEAFGVALDGLPGALVTVHAMDLIRLGRDRRMYEWETIARLPLGGPAATP